MTSLRALGTAALGGFLLTATVVVGLRAADAAITVGAFALVTVLLTWYARWGSNDAGSALAVTNPIAALALVSVKRLAAADLLPVVAAQVVGAVVAGGLGLLTEDVLGEPLVWTAPTVLVTLVVAVLAGAVATWATLAVDADGPVALAAAAPVVAGAGASLVLVAVAHPAVLVGLAVTGLVDLTTAGFGIAAALLTSLVAARTVSVLVPRSAD